MIEIVIKTHLKLLPEYCDDCVYFSSRPHPYKGWTMFCELCAECLDDDNNDDKWVYDGNGRPKNCPLKELEVEDDDLA